MGCSGGLRLGVLEAFLRLRRLMCGKPPALRQVSMNTGWGYAPKTGRSPTQSKKPRAERHSLSAHQTAKPQEGLLTQS